MDVLRLNTTSFLPDELVENYSSMIWTERKSTHGEFELRTPQVEATKLLLPEKSLITHLETEEVMIVETHSIDYDSDGIPELLIQGRTFGSFLENRAALSIVMGEDWTAPQYSSISDITVLLLWTYLANNSGEDPTKPNATMTLEDYVSNLVITDSTPINETLQYWTLSAGEIASKVLDYVTLGSFGLRTIRPLGTSGNVVSVDTSRTTSRGTVSRSLVEDIDSLRIDIYTGRDRSRNQDLLEPVIFSHAAEDVEDPKYLFSSKRLKNVALVDTISGVMEIWPDNVEPAPRPNGLDRRVLYVNAGDITEASGTEYFLDAVNQKAQIELKKHNREVAFDSAISPHSRYEYKKDYFLGDKVTLLAEYGFEETMEVVEYVRTEDQSGDRGYPTLVLAE